jgi:RNA polymerase sigma factor (sigma-70 family)
MPDRQELEALFLAHLGLVERVVASTCSRHGIRGDDAADCASWIKLRLVEDDYAILRKFRGESSLGTYLTVVIATLVRDYRVRRWGRWRPSAVAKRRGPLAARLERLVGQGYSLNEATEGLRSSADAALTEPQVAAIFRELPARKPTRPVDVGPDPLDAAAAATRADDRVDTQTAAAERETIERAVIRALEQLSPQDRLILRLRYWADSSVADIARALGLPQKPLYRQIERALATLRAQLETAHVSRERVRELLDGLDP